MRKKFRLTFDGELLEMQRRRMNLGFGPFARLLGLTLGQYIRLVRGKIALPPHAWANLIAHQRRQ